MKRQASTNPTCFPFQMVAFSGFRVSAASADRRNDSEEARLAMTSCVGAGRPEPPSSLRRFSYPRDQALMTHGFLQLTINPETGEEVSKSIIKPQVIFTVETYNPRLVRQKFGTLGPHQYQWFSNAYILISLDNLIFSSMSRVAPAASIMASTSGMLVPDGFHCESE